jgi:hypothetical protein
MAGTNMTSRELNVCGFKYTQQPDTAHGESRYTYWKWDALDFQELEVSLLANGPDGWFCARYQDPPLFPTPEEAFRWGQARTINRTKVMLARSLRMFTHLLVRLYRA